MSEDLNKIIKKLEDLKNRVENKDNEVKEIINSCHGIGKSWSGSSLVGHAKFYYKNFEEPDVYNKFSIEWGLINGVPDGWEEKSSEVVRQKIESISGFDLEKLRDFATKIEQDFIDLQRDVILTLSDIGLKNIDKVENFSFQSATDYFNSIFPRKFMTRDSESATGNYIVPHIYYESIALFVKNFPEDIKSFLFEIKKIIKTTNLKEINSIDDNKNGYYVENSTIIKLSNIKSENYDLSKLIKFCHELNDNYSLGNYLSCGMILRSILNHIPPIFKKKDFNEVSSNYGTQSFKDIIKPLQESSRKISDSYLHALITKKEILPTKTQISFQPNLDCLLSEIIRILE